MKERDLTLDRAIEIGLLMNCPTETTPSSRTVNKDEIHSVGRGKKFPHRKKHQNLTFVIARLVAEIIRKNFRTGPYFIMHAFLIINICGLLFFETMHIPKCTEYIHQ